MRFIFGMSHRLSYKVVTRTRVSKVRVHPRNAVMCLALVRKEEPRFIQLIPSTSESSYTQKNDTFTNFHVICDPLTGSRNVSARNKRLKWFLPENPYLDGSMRRGRNKSLKCPRFRCSNTDDQPCHRCAQFGRTHRRIRLTRTNRKCR